MGKREMYELYRGAHPGTIVQVDSFGPRYAQLVRGGLMIEVGEGVCEFTKQMVTHWDVTPMVPRTRLSTKPNGPTRRELLGMIAKLQLDIVLKDATITRLKEKLGSGQGELF